MDSNKRNTAFLLLFLAIQSISFAQDCNSLRQPNETYGAGEGKDASWCNMQNPTAYTDCMCEQENANKVSAIEQQNLQKQALSKSTEASALYQQAHNLATQANLDKDPSKLDEAKTLYQQAIALSNQAKGFIEQAYAGADPSYNRLKNLYLEQYNKQIEWATTGIESIPNQKDRIKAETNQKQITLNPKKPSTSNNWNLNAETKADNSWANDHTENDKGSSELNKLELETFRENFYEGLRYTGTNKIVVPADKYYSIYLVGDYYAAKKLSYKYLDDIRYEKRVAVNPLTLAQVKSNFSSWVLINTNGDIVISDGFDSIDFDKTTSKYTITRYADIELIRIECARQNDPRNQSTYCYKMKGRPVEFTLNNDLIMIKKEVKSWTSIR